jgi:hypothetical protein
LGSEEGNLNKYEMVSFLPEPRCVLPFLLILSATTIVQTLLSVD